MDAYNRYSEFYAQGRYQEAFPFAEKAVRLGEEEFGPDHLSTATLLNNLADLYRAQGRYAEAEPLHKRALAIREKALGPEHPDVAQSVNNLAALYHAQGKYAEAEPLFERSLVIWKNALGPNHPEVVTNLSNLAGLPVAINGARIKVVCYVADPGHVHYAGALPLAEVARVIRSGRGVSGDNPYDLRNVAAHLDELGIADGPIHRLMDLVEGAAAP